jgi:hypothetical protein
VDSVLVSLDSLLGTSFLGRPALAALVLLLASIPALEGGPTGRKILAWTKHGSAHKTTFISVRPVPKPDLFKSFPAVDGPEEIGRGGRMWIGIVGSGFKRVN